VRSVKPSADKYIDKMIELAQAAKKRVAERNQQAKDAPKGVEERKATEEKTEAKET